MSVRMKGAGLVEVLVAMVILTVGLVSLAEIMLARDLKTRVVERDGNRIVLVSWSKRGAAGKRKLWTPRIEEVTLGMFPDVEAA